jgi:glycosyltransferase involved in cell wall biosynthesis
MRGRLRGGTRALPPASERSELVSVITIAYKSCQTLARTIDSIAAQTHPAIEYIVIDGGSDDGTVQLLGQRDKDINQWISEPDAGISDAFNKGIALSHGEYIALVNSDDWLEPQHLKVAIEALTRQSGGFVFGDLVLHGPDDRPSHIIRGDPHYERSIRHAMPALNHPTVVCRRSVYESCGVFDVKLRVAMDYEWLLRGYRRGVVGRYTPGLVTHMSLRGVSNTEFWRAARETRDISVRYGYPALLAQFRFAARVVRISLGRALCVLLPRGSYEWLRRRKNPYYRSIRSVQDGEAC